MEPLHFLNVIYTPHSDCVLKLRLKAWAPESIEPPFLIQAQDYNVVDIENVSKDSDLFTAGVKSRSAIHVTDLSETWIQK